ncbi:TetR/AcrR family transcriptional regulator [Streptomyces capitiformicae]|uniref:TetR family transcriptional regulator n=1 Tax=Streptomyces capitiformicae TaxID=2014920 RepID=A0A918ZBD0_9ACTN|nr:TetR/AcrR family transcriptional regulator [Streptomyces capitiformicae]GHE44525.1 TetR family transcriptional regulator [Streptomyces capitiformicae]
MDVIQGAKERVRAEVAGAIKGEACRQLAAEGAARLSLRAVARELGMASSALYRYFPSRDDLLTALIVDAYDAIGQAAESAFTRAGVTDPQHAWVEICRAVRAWALEHPHEYALIYGSPVPGYAAPQDTVAPASRVALVLLAVAEAAHDAGLLAEPDLPAADCDAVVAEEIRRLLEQPDRILPGAVVPRLAAAWAQLFGLISFEVFGQFNRVIDDRDTLFENAVVALALQVGLRSTGPDARA